MSRRHRSTLRFGLLLAAPIGDRHLVIASVAAAHGLKVVTNNLRESDASPVSTRESWA